jgi:hypothetical protein
MTKLKAVKPEQAVIGKPKIAVMGSFGVGKTWGLLDFPATFYIDSEGGANLPHYLEKLKKAGGEYLGPKQGSTDFDFVIEQVKALATEQHNYKTLVIDSGTKLFHNEKTKEAERMERAKESDKFSASKKPAVKLSNRLLYWIEKVDMNVVIVTHEKAKFENGEQIDTVPDFTDTLGHDLHLLLRIIKMGDTRKAFIKKSRLIGFPDSGSFDWSYDEFAKRYGKEIMESEAKPVILASKDQIEQIKKLLETVRLGNSAQDKWIAENQDTLTELLYDKADNVIKHLRSKIELTPTPKV